jgi:WD40 repeat protein
VELRDAATGAVTAVLRGHSGRIGQARFSADGQQIATASEDGTARVWLTATGTPVSVLGVHEGGVDGAAFAPDGTLVATAGSAGAGDGTGGGTVRIAEAATGRLLSVLRVPSGRIDDVRFSADGARVLVKAGDGTFAYLVHIEDLMTLARTRAGRELRPKERTQYLGE